MSEVFVFAAAAISILGAAAYIRSMLRGGAKPNRVSWLMWSIAPFIATAAALSKGVGWAALPVFMSGFMPFLIFLVSFFTRRAYWKLTRFDYLCGGVSALALVLWYLTMDPNVAIVFAIISDAVAAVPTITKALKQPESESPWPFITGTINGVAAYPAARFWNFTELAFPTYLIAINILLTLAVYHKKLRIEYKTSLVKVS